ncbi:band 7 protein [Acinetobacter lwoffii]|nr:band 7 protein [Acinetobacter lwoffii]
MLTFDLYNILIIAGIIFVALVTFGLIIARLYRRSSKEISFVRTGWGGEKVIMSYSTC